MWCGGRNFAERFARSSGRTAWSASSRFPGRRRRSGERLAPGPTKRRSREPATAPAFARLPCRRRHRGLQARRGGAIVARGSSEPEEALHRIRHVVPLAALSVLLLLALPADAHTGPGLAGGFVSGFARSEEHTSELQSLMRISYAVFCL